MDTHPDTNSLNVFSGPGAMRDFFNPDRAPFLPLVELPEALNPLSASRVKIFAKLAYLLPLLNIKSLPAYNMMLAAERQGKLEGVDTVVENSSGNTAFSLAIVAKLFGIRHVKAIVPWDIAPGKLELLRLAGAEPMLHKGEAGEPGGIEKARIMGNDPALFNPGQYENEANPNAIEQWIAPQIWKQLQGTLTVFCAGLGTTGTVLGASRFLKKQNKNIAVVGSIVAPGSAIPGVRTAERLKEIKLDWQGAVDYQVEVKTKDSFKKSLELCRAGIMAGPSSGFALAGLLSFLEQQPAQSLDALRNANGDVVAAFVCPDTPLPYLDKYSTHLDPGDF